jgi:hypothetical protein
MSKVDNFAAALMANHKDAGAGANKGAPRKMKHKKGMQTMKKQGTGKTMKAVKGGKRKVGL